MSGMWKWRMASAKQTLSCVSCVPCIPCATDGAGCEVRATALETHRQGSCHPHSRSCARLHRQSHAWGQCDWQCSAVGVVALPAAPPASVPEIVSLRATACLRVVVSLRVAAYLRVLVFVRHRQRGAQRCEQGRAVLAR